MSGSTFYEDNSGAIVMATGSSMTHKSKHIVVNHHGFRKHAVNTVLICNIK